MTELRHALLVGDFAHINGGQAKVSIDSARLLADAGINVTFFAAVAPIAPELDHPNINVICLDQKDILEDPNRLRALRRGIWNREAATKLRALAQQFDPATSVLHCHGYAKALSPSIGPVLAARHLPTVYTMHEYFLACPNGGFYDYQSHEICHRKALGASCLTTHCDVRHPAHKVWRVARQAATWGPGRMPKGLQDIIYISELQKQALSPYFGPKTHLHHVPNPVPAPALPPVQAQDNEIMLFIGRLNPEKGGLMFAKAAKQAGVRAVFVGDGAEREAIEAANPEAEIIGWQSPEEVQQWLGKARALIFPSLWYEGQPLVPLEALMRSIPVVCGNWSAARECVEHGKNGLIYKTPSVEALAEALTQVDQIPAFDGAALHDTISPERHFENLMDVYGKITQRHQAA
ncbi:MAG: glycosyltransferase family 4 protein [Mangrovicoccus sp.]|nr:glycosyltransferase family 4 protein [Mangrovicoccus sp.]